MSIINFDDVCFTYAHTEEPALDRINLSVTQGEFFAVMGENGAGKTTLCKLINGIIPHFSGGRLTGKVTVGGCDTGSSSVAELSFKAGIVLDDPDAQLFTSSVRHEAAFGPENMCLPREEIEERVKFALAAAGLDGFEDRLPSTLSGGEKQRLSIAAALAMKSGILVLDEPLSRLDPEGAARVMSVLNDIKIKYGITVVMASHNSGLIAEYADRVCILKNGRIAALERAENIFLNLKLLEENGIKPPEDKNNENFQNIFPEYPSSSGNPVINIKNFCFRYSNGAVIENINLEIYDNDFISLMGSNGCGKTTLLKNITGLLRPSSGDIFIHGKNTRELSVGGISEEIGFVMQNPDTQLFTDTVFNEAAFALKNMLVETHQGKRRRLSKSEIKQRVEDALAAVNLRSADAFPFALSRSDRTKTVIACVLAMGTRIILFDEVDVGNDYKSSLEIMNTAKNLHSKGYTIIFVTHNISLARDYAHRLVIMDRSGIVFDGKREAESHSI